MTPATVSATVSVGGEIGEVGGKNSDVHELHVVLRPSVRSPAWPLLLEEGHEAGDHHLAVGPPTAGRR